MKSIRQISRLGRLRRFRSMARSALEAYGLPDAVLTFLSYNGNIIYRVDDPVAIGSARNDGPFVDGRYVLRIHMDYHSTEAIRSELQWLKALRCDLDLAVPEPVATLAGELTGEIMSPCGEVCRKYSLLKWLDGRFVSRRFGREHARAWGRLMARMHSHAESWQLPEGFTRRRRDWAGLFGDEAGFETPVAGLWEAVPDQFREPFEDVTNQLRDVTGRLGHGPDVFGLVHADLDVFTNVLFAQGEARPIDFDDCCFAYWLHDLAFALCPWQGRGEYARVQATFLEGYAEVRAIPQTQLAHLELFKAAFNANLVLWMIDWMMLSPKSDEPIKFVNKYGENMLRYFDK